MGFFGRLKKEIWKVVRGILILGVVISVIITIVTYGKRIKRPESVEMIIDADTGNEIDDLYAITLALIDPKIDVIALTSAQYKFHPTRGGDSTVFESQELNEQILKLHDKFNIPHPRGADGPINMLPPDKLQSPAAKYIVAQMDSLDYGEKLNVVTLGAPTNLAAAIMIDSSISARIRWYGMGLIYNDMDRIWNKNEFNSRNDLDAIDFLLNKSDLETYIMTANTSSNYEFDQTETFDLLRNRAPKYQLLVDRWYDVFPEQRTRPMYDVSIIHAIMNPDLTQQKDVWTPPENTRRRVTVYTWIDEEKMLREFIRLLRIDLGDISSDIK